METPDIKTNHNSSRSVFFHHHFIYQVAGLWRVNYGCVNLSTRFKLPHPCYGSIVAHGSSSKKEQQRSSRLTWGRSQRSRHMVWQSLLSCSVKREGDIDDTQWFSLFMTPIKFQHFFDMYVDTILESYCMSVCNISYRCAFQKIFTSAPFSPLIHAYKLMYLSKTV